MASIKSESLGGKEELDINVKACDENTGRSVAPSIWSTRPSVGGTISQVRKVESNRACSPLGHPPNARPHPSSGGSAFKATISYFPKEKSPDLNIFGNTL